MIVNRLLTLADKPQLKDILDSFVLSTDVKFSVRSIEHNRGLANFILDHFIEEYSDSMVVSGSFIDGKLIRICVGSKFHPYFKVALKNAIPSWVLVLMYSRDITISNPATRIFDTGTHLVRYMESQGFYTFYQFYKFPNLNSVADYQKYINNYFSKMSIMDRYVNLLEYVLHEDTNVSEIPFGIYRDLIANILEKRSRKLCITSHHLKNEYRNFNL